VVSKSGPNQFHGGLPLAASITTIFGSLRQPDGTILDVTEIQSK